MNEKVIRTWISDPHRRRVMRSCSQEQRRSVEGGRAGRVFSRVSPSLRSVEGVTSNRDPYSDSEDEVQSADHTLATEDKHDKAKNAVGPAKLSSGSLQSSTAMVLAVRLSNRPVVLLTRLTAKSTASLSSRRWSHASEDREKLGNRHSLEQIIVRTTVRCALAIGCAIPGRQEQDRRTS